MAVLTYRDFLSPEDIKRIETDAYDVEAGKAGYQQYLADLQPEIEAKAAAEEAERNKPFWQKYMESVSFDTATTVSNTMAKAMKTVQADKSYQRPSDDWTEDELYRFGEKYAKDKEAAYEYAEKVNNAHARAKKLEQEQALADWTNQNAGTRILGSAASLATNMFAGGVGAADALLQRAWRGKYVENDVLYPHEMANAMQGAVAQKYNEFSGTINEDVPIFGGKGAGDVYNLGMSLVQSVISAKTGGSIGTLVSYFGTAASNGTTDALSRGANVDQALTYGLISGAAEAIPEMVSVSSLLKIGAADGVSNLFKSVLKQALQEGEEEALTSTINLVADQLVMQDKSALNARIAELVAQGMSVDEATKKAWIENVESIAFDAIAGAASGGISGGLQAGTATIADRLDTKANAKAKEALGDMSSELLDIASKTEDKSTQALAAKYTKRVNSGKELGGYQLRKLTDKIASGSANAARTNAQQKISERYAELGGKASNGLSNIIMRKAMGEEISVPQSIRLKNDKLATQIINEIQNSTTGAYDSKWLSGTMLEEVGAGATASATPSVPAAEGNISAFKPSSAESRIHTEGITSKLTKTDVGNLRAIEKLANALDIDIHVYETTLNEDGTRTYTDKNGKKLSDSGYFDPSDNSIHIDLRAGENGEGTMLYTASHEVVHFIKENASAHYDALEKLVTKALIDGGMTLDGLIDIQRQKAIANGQTLTDAELREEMIAEACQSFLADKGAIAKIQALRTENHGLWSALKRFFTSLFEKVNKLYKNVPPDSVEGRYIADMRRAAKKIKDAFIEGAVAAGENYAAERKALGKSSEIKVNSKGEFVQGKTTDGKKILTNARTYRSGGRSTLEATLKAEGFSDGDVKAALAIMDGHMELVQRFGAQYTAQDVANNATVSTDLKTGESVLSALISNGDYPVNIDLLTICKKRKAYQQVINRLCESGLIKTATLDSLAIAEINKILGKYGFETACLGCYVESRRIRIQEWAETICKEWNAAVDKLVGKGKAEFFNTSSPTFVKDLSNEEIQKLSNELDEAYERDGLKYGRKKVAEKMAQLVKEVPSLRKYLSVADLITPEGRTNLRKLSTEIDSLVACRYGSNTPKIIQEFNPYNSELAMYGKVPKRYRSLRDYLYAIGGARMQSFSDFIVENWFDYAQIVADLSARKLPMHTYTKELALVKLFGMTGIKINMSLIPDVDASLGKEYAGLTKNENGEYELIFADKDRYKATGGKSYMQSFNFADAIAMQEDPNYSANVGTIAIGISDRQIEMMLADPRIRMVIPYHTSGMNPIFAHLVGVANYSDYTVDQTTGVKSIVDKDGKPISVTLKKTQKMNLASGFEFNEALQRLGDARAAAKEYLEWCADSSKHSIEINGKTYYATLKPKFEQFSTDENYYKLLADYNPYDCITEESRPQGDVTQTYPADFAEMLEAEIKRSDAYREKQDAKWGDAMAEIESYLSTHTRADTVAYADEHGIKLSKKDRTAAKVRSKARGADKLNLSGKSKITAGMTDAERYELIRNREIDAPYYNGEADRLIAEEIESKKHKYAKDAIVAIADKIGIKKEEINFNDVEAVITLSNRNIGESVSNKATPTQIAKLLPILSDVARDSVLVERHVNRYYHDTDTIFFDNLMGAYVDGEDVVPIRFGLKHSRTGTTKLYVVVDQNKIPQKNLTKNKKSMGHQDASSDSSSGLSNLRRHATYSLAQVISFVNSEDLLKYIPDQMLNESQLELKGIGMAKSLLHTNDTNDKHYAAAIKRNDKRTLAQMIDAAAKTNGYHYRGYHGTQANRFNEFKRGIAGIYLATNKQLADDFATTWGGGKGTVYDLYVKMDNPLIVDKHTDSEVPYYYNIPTPSIMKDAGYTQHTVSIEEIAHFAEDHNYDGVVIKGIREGTGVFTDDIIVFDPTQVKSADSITYDDNDNVIPISERFNSASNDIRHKSRAPVSAPYASPTAQSIVTNIQQAYEPTKKDVLVSGAIATQIALTNAQAGIESVAKKYGFKNIESLVQSARTATKQAEEMIGGNQYRIGSASKDYQGEGLQRIIAPIKDKGDEVYAAFLDYLFHQHNADRMSLERRSIEWNEEKKAELTKQTQRFASLQREQTDLKKEREQYARKRNDAAKTERDRIDRRLAQIKRELAVVSKIMRKLQQEISAFTVLKNKPVLARPKEEIEAKKAEINARIAELSDEKKSLGLSKANAERVKAISAEIADLTKQSLEIEAPISEEESRKIIEEYEANYDYFLETAEKVWKYNANLNQYRVDTGLISQEQYDYLQKLYAHYVPTYRDGSNSGIAAVRGKNNLAVNQSIKSATGSTRDLLDPIVIMARQTMETIRAGRINKIADALYEGAIANGDKTYIAEASRKRLTQEELADLDPTELRPKSNQVTFFKDGEKITLNVSSEIFAGFNAFSPDLDIKNPLMIVVNKTNEVFKKLVTSWNPVFLLRNAVRDLQDAGINTKYFNTFGITLAVAHKEILTNGELWKLYRAMGGSNVEVFDFDKGFKKEATERGFDTRWWKMMENANNYIECIPRFTEFICSLKAGNTAEQAMLDAADVTTNFARAGTISKKLNATVIPFLNPAIQGASKAVRNVTSAFTENKGAKAKALAIAQLVTKAVLIGVVPFVLNSILLGDDEDYKDLRDTDKENYFLFKIGEKFIKIPRGRMAAVLAGLTNRTAKSFTDEDPDWKGYIKNASTQMNPIENMARTIASPFLDVKNNVTWYGSAIEGKQFENVEPAKRYDESTSSIAIALGKAFNYSPKKIHYILDQYSGVIGDFVLPMTSKKAEKDFLSSNFVIDPVTSNNLSDKFYDIYYEAQYAKSADEDNKTAEYQVKHLNRVKTAISKLYDEISTIQNSEMSDREKLAEIRTLQVMINEMYKTAINDYELVTNAIEATSSVDDSYRYTEVTRLVYGAERALREYDDSVYSKSTVLRKAGISYDNFYKYYFSLRGIESDKDKYGNTIPGSKKEKIIANINKLNLSSEKKQLLIAASGYAVEDEDALIKYINSLRLSRKTTLDLAEICGFEVKNGKITK